MILLPLPTSAAVPQGPARPCRPAPGSDGVARLVERLLQSQPLAERVQAATMDWCDAELAAFDEQPVGGPLDLAMPGLELHELHSATLRRRLFGA